MPMTTFYSEWELANMRSVQNAELNELFQEVRKKFDNKYYIHERTFTVNGWFRTKTKTMYMVLYDYTGRGGEFQVINFCSDEGSSINSYVSTSLLHTMLMSLLNGYDYYKSNKANVKEEEK